MWRTLEYSDFLENKCQHSACFETVESGVIFISLIINATGYSHAQRALRYFRGRGM